MFTDKRGCSWWRPLPGLGDLALFQALEHGFFAIEDIRRSGKGCSLVQVSSAPTKRPLDSFGTSCDQGILPELWNCAWNSRILMPRLFSGDLANSSFVAQIASPDENQSKKTVAVRKQRFSLPPRYNIFRFPVFWMHLQVSQSIGIASCVLRLLQMISNCVASPTAESHSARQSPDPERWPDSVQLSGQSPQGI